MAKNHWYQSLLDSVRYSSTLPQALPLSSSFLSLFVISVLIHVNIEVATVTSSPDSPRSIAAYLDANKLQVSKYNKKREKKGEEHRGRSGGKDINDYTGTQRVASGAHSGVVAHGPCTALVHALPCAALPHPWP